MLCEVYRIKPRRMHQKLEPTSQIARTLPERRRVPRGGYKRIEMGAAGPASQGEEEEGHES